MADKAAAAGGLRALAAGTEGKSGSALVYELLADIEAALTTGVARKTVLAALNRDYGLTMTMSGFEKALKKARVREPTETPSQLKQRKLTDDIPQRKALTGDGTAPPPSFKTPAQLKKWMAENRIGEETDNNAFTDNWTYEDTHETSGY
ncbi:hypothetical protein [Methylovulum psychrotolerans]|uniref:Uncharacterized protein n=1 Tax=Methylovulum psychrotolerans TaxID=1704499 RepID=A0A2S5CIP1_9GAMM|nr:hypothetical protein [Methylovulum psychrotolerans]POZ50683.1 hypothetical protein AADEFJLK_03580 [Methylovulum psychrotolerans]